jgi:hypothetical protein
MSSRNAAALSFRGSSAIFPRHGTSPTRPPPTTPDEMKALVFDRFGGPEVLEHRDVPDPVPRPGEARVRLAAVGLNFADV